MDCDSCWELKVLVNFCDMLKTPSISGADYADHEQSDAKNSTVEGSHPWLPLQLVKHFTVSINSRLSADIYYWPPNLREVYVPFIGNIRNHTKGGQVATVYGELSEAVLVNC